MANEANRVEQIQQAMGTAGVDALVLRLAENILLATGWFARFSGLGFVVVPADGGAVLIVPEVEEREAAEEWDGAIATFPAGRTDGEPLDTALPRILGEVGSDIGVRGGRIGFEGSFETLGPPSFFGEPNAIAEPTRALIETAFRTESLVDFTDQLEEIRAVKTERELDLIRRTNEIAAFGLEAFKRAAVPGASEVEVMAAVEQAITVQGHGHRGARCVRGFATIGSGPDLANGWWYFRGSTRKIEPGDAVMIELGTVADGYWSDHTRTVVAGKATQPLAEAYAAVRAGLDAAFAAARPGATGGEVDAASRAAVAARGAEQYAHHTGHGVGFRYHESRPALVPGSSAVLAANQVLAMEPGIYSPELGGGVRHEDDAVVTESGAVALASTDFGFELE
jgi:Xaa-Pro aminopeptidase